MIFRKVKENLDELLVHTFHIKKIYLFKKYKKRFGNLNRDNDKRFANYLNGLVFEITREKFK